MPQTLFDYFQSLNSKPKAWNKILELFTYVEYEKETFLCKRNEFPSKIYFIKSGVIRGFFTHENGFEYNKLLFMDNHIAASITALSHKIPSKIELQCLTNCEIYEGNYYDLMDVINNDLELSKLYIESQHYLYKVLEESEIDQVILSSSERYQKLLEEFPNIENRIMLYHIASHLGITPIQLSRVRKSLSETSLPS